MPRLLTVARSAPPNCIAQITDYLERRAAVYPVDFLAPGIPWPAIGRIFVLMSGRRKLVGVHRTFANDEKAVFINCPLGAAECFPNDRFGVLCFLNPICEKKQVIYNLLSRILSRENRFFRLDPLFVFSGLKTLS